MNLTRYHGVFAPNSRLRVAITPGKRGRRADVMESAESETGVERRRFCRIDGSHAIDGMLTPSGRDAGPGDRRAGVDSAIFQNNCGEPG